jgi:hypothetical protein
MSGSFILSKVFLFYCPLHAQTAVFASSWVCIFIDVSEITGPARSPASAFFYLTDFSDPSMKFYGVVWLEKSV